jgi:hypothetical protein
MWGALHDWHVPKKKNCSVYRIEEDEISGACSMHWGQHKSEGKNHMENLGVDEGITLKLSLE